MQRSKSTTNSKKRLKQANKTTIIGAVLNIALSITKILAGVFGKSQAMVADGIHSLSDLGSDLAVLTGMVLASRPEDSTHNYGHGKFETLSTLIIGIILVTTGVGIGYSSINNIIEIIQGEILEKPHLTALVAAITSVIMKEGLYRYTIHKGRIMNSPVIIANAYHHRSDAYSSLGTTLGIGGAIILGNKWIILDPIAGFIVSLIILKEAFKIIKGSLDELLEAAIPLETQNIILKTANSVPGVYKPHNLKTRKIGGTTAIDLHIYVNSSISIEKAHFIGHVVEESIERKLGENIIFNITVVPYSPILQMI